METISNSLFWISNGLLVPVIVLLLLFFLRAIILAGGKSIMACWVTNETTKATLRNVGNHHS